MLLGVSSRVGASPFSSKRPKRALPVRAQHALPKSEGHEEFATRRGLLAALGMVGAFAAANAADAKSADPYEEMKSITASRTGGGGLLESFGATSSTSKADRGIRQKLAAQATSAAPSSRSPASLATSAFKKPAGAAAGGAAAAAAGVNPAVAAGGAVVVLGAAAAAAGGKKVGKKDSAAAPSRGGSTKKVAAPVAPRGGSVKVAKSRATSPAPKSRAASPAPKSRPASPVMKPVAAAAAAGGSVKRGLFGLGSKVASATPAKGTQTMKKEGSVKKGMFGLGRKAAAAAPAKGTLTVKKPAPVKKVAAFSARDKGQVVGGDNSSGTAIKTVIKKVLVNEENPNEPTDAAVGGLWAVAAAVAAFLLFGQPAAKLSTPAGSSSSSDPLVELAKEQARVGPAQTIKSDKPLKAPAAPAPPPPPPVVAVEEAKEVEVPAKPPAPAPAPKLQPPAAFAPAPAAKVEEKKPQLPTVAAPNKQADKPAATAGKEEAAAAGAASGSNLGLIGAFTAVLVGAFAFLGKGGEESSSSSTTTTGSAPPAAEGTGAAAAAAAPPAEGAAPAAAGAPAGEGAPGAAATGEQQAAYERALSVMFSRPEVVDILYPVIVPHLRNPPALAWALTSNAENAANLDGLAFQRLPTPKYQQVRSLFAEMGLSLPESPRTVVTNEPGGAVEGVEPEALRGVFQKLLANESSRELMKQLLAGAQLEFNEGAFEAQVADGTYFNVAIAPILRKMPPAKLAVLASLQDPKVMEGLIRSVDAIAADSGTFQAVTQELSGDVRSTVERITDPSIDASNN